MVLAVALLALKGLKPRTDYTHQKDYLHPDMLQTANLGSFG